MTFLLVLGVSLTVARDIHIHISVRSNGMEPKSGMYEKVPNALIAGRSS